MTEGRKVVHPEAPLEGMDKEKDLKDYPFLVKTLITYTKLNAQGSEVKHKDEVVFKLDIASARMPWYVLRNYTAPKYLTKKYGPFEVGWQRIYEIKILKLINRKNPNDISEIPLRVMTLAQLDSYVERWDLGVEVTEFYSVEKAREMVALRQSDEKGFQKHLQEYREGKQRNYPELDNMRGDQDAAMGAEGEFEGLETRVTSPVRGRKPLPTLAVTELTPEDREILGPDTLEDPFKGV